MRSSPRRASPNSARPPPVDYDGPGDGWSPERLLLASMRACFLFTLRAIARLSKVDFLALDLDAPGTVHRQDGVLKPRSSRIEEEPMTWELLLVVVVVGLVAGLGFAYVRSRKPGGG